MSQKGVRKSQNAALTEDKEKRQTDSPVKEMKKKIAANAEKEKQAVDKTDKTVKSPERSDKNAEKPDKVSEKTLNAEKADSKKAQTAEKIDKNAATPDKNAQKNGKNSEKADKIVEKPDKNAEKTDKPVEKAEKKTDKVADKKVDKPVDKKSDLEKKEEGKGDANAKDKQEKPKQNGAATGEPNGTGDTVSEPDSSEEDLLVIDDQDEVFPELTYDETSDVDYEEGAPSRSFTRRSQVKATKTPETPRPTSVKEDDSKEKLLKMNDSLVTDRKLRSADSPKPESKKPVDLKKAQDSPKKDKTIDLTEDESEKNKEGNENNKEGTEKSEERKVNAGTSGKNKLEMEVVVELDSLEGEAPPSKTRARVSPYTRLPAVVGRHDQTTSSMMANYTGNNTTMEMDLSESSSLLEEPLDDSSYLRGLRSIRGRTSYKPLKELSLRRATRSMASAVSAVNTSASEPARPTGTVVGRKRKPDADEASEPALSASEGSEGSERDDDLLYAHHKRMRLFERFSAPFRGFHARRAAEIVGINSDLPLTAPVASPSTFDPETLKPSPSEPIAVPLPTPTHDRDGKRCIIV